MALAVCAVIQLAVVTERLTASRAEGGAEILAPEAGPRSEAGGRAVPPRPGVGVVHSPRGVPVPVLGIRDGGWLVSTPCGNEAVLPRAVPVARPRVVLDPGHGGRFDTGAVGPNGLIEAELNLAVARHARDALERSGIPTLLTRTGDYGLTLVNRGRLPVDVGAEVSVSLHHNGGATARKSGPGSEVYHQIDSPESQRLAGLLYEEIVATLSAYGGVEWVGRVDVGATWRVGPSGQDYYALVRRPRPVPAVLVEFAYLTNADEARLLADGRVQQAEGEAVARALRRYFNTPDPGSGFTPGGQITPTGRPPTPSSACDDPIL